MDEATQAMTEQQPNDEPEPNAEQHIPYQPEDECGGWEEAPARVSNELVGGGNPEFRPSVPHRQLQRA